MQAAPKVHYALCSRGGYHTGEALNMVCLEAKCQAAQLCCCACVEEAHKDHNTKPLRVVMLDAQQVATKIVPAKFSIDAALELLSNHEQQSLEMFAQHKKEIFGVMEKIEGSLKDYYRFLADQVRLKSIDPKIEIEQAFLTIQAQAAKQEDYEVAVRRVAGLLSVKKEEGVLTEGDVISSLNASNEDLRKKMQGNSGDLLKQLQKYLKDVLDSIRDDNLWKQGGVFKFSPTFKHPDIKLLSEYLVKSANNSGYKFVVMEPHIESGGVKQVAWKIKESLSNWVAVGVCHPKLVASKNYGFNFSTIGHGAYMVSANGGSWSHTKAEHNNSVKSFKFAKGDIIQLTLSPAEKSLNFKKGTQTYSLPYEPLPGDELSPCVLFYYLNDEVEFLPDYKG